MNFLYNNLKRVLIISRIYNGEDFADIFDGTDESECMKPCLSTKVYNNIKVEVLINFVGFQVSGTFLHGSQYPETVFDFTFNQKVLTREFYFPDFSLTRFFSELGGALGLWLGIGAVQMMNVLIVTFNWMRGYIIAGKAH